MLQAFEGIIDASGLRSLRQDGSCLPMPRDYRPDEVPFWAVLDTDAASRILRELFAGNRRQALTLLEASAVSLGSRLDTPAGRRHQ
jgi:hypothetical protein